MGGGGGGSPSSEQEEGTKPIGEKPYGCCTFIQHSEIMKMPSAGHENYARWHEIFTSSSFFDPTAQIPPPIDPTDENASRKSIGRPDSSEL